MALIVVIWVTALLMVVLSAFAFSMRTEVDAARNFKEEAEAAALAEAGVARALAELVNAGWKGQEAMAAAATYRSGDVPFGRGTFHVTVTDEERKIHLNRATPEVLARLLQNTGVELQLAQAIADAILDWRDADSLHRVNGAEADYYQSLPSPYHPRNADFETLEELLLVKDVTPAIFYGTAEPERLDALLARLPGERELKPGEYLGIARFLTIRGSGRVNLNTAGMDVLMAMGLPEAEARALLETRADGLLYREQPRAARGPQFTLASTTYAIEAYGSLPGSPTTYRITALVGNEGIPPKFRPRILAWKEGA